ncbi:MAG: hypothetical protein P8Y36_12010, partial [Alphaproteobacteria bacterium]
GQIAHDTSGAALFVVLRAFSCTAYDGLKVLIHATSHDRDRSQALSEFAKLFQDISPDSMAYLLSAWRGEVLPVAEISDGIETVCVVGGDDPGHIGEGGYTGELFPVNPKRRTVYGLRQSRHLPPERHLWRSAPANFSVPLRHRPAPSQGLGSG